MGVLVIARVPFYGSPKQTHERLLFPSPRLRKMTRSFNEGSSAQLLRAGLAKTDYEDRNSEKIFGGRPEEFPGRPGKLFC